MRRAGSGKSLGMRGERRLEKVLKRASVVQGSDHAFAAGSG